MTAWADIQESWAENNEDKMVTRILLWDLSAAFESGSSLSKVDPIWIWRLDSNIK